MLTYHPSPYSSPNSYSDSSNDSVSPRHMQEHAVIGIVFFQGWDMTNTKILRREESAWSRPYPQGSLVHSYSPFALCLPDSLDSPSRFPWWVRRRQRPLSSSLSPCVLDSQVQGLWPSLSARVPFEPSHYCITLHFPPQTSPEE